jgi:hypothetical protein
VEDDDDDRPDSSVWIRSRRFLGKNTDSMVVGLLLFCWSYTSEKYVMAMVVPLLTFMSVTQDVLQTRTWKCDDGTAETVEAAINQSSSRSPFCYVLLNTVY